MIRIGDVDIVLEFFLENISGTPEDLRDQVLCERSGHGRHGSSNLYHEVPVQIPLLLRHRFHDIPRYLLQSLLLRGLRLS